MTMVTPEFGLVLGAPVADVDPEVWAAIEGERHASTTRSS